jgi:2-succinyl-5-enolpyruvyl-6-hydroxy-3-cyclohexene-1-carboxylate synthase
MEATAGIVKGQAMIRNAWQQVVSCLEDEGVEYVFGLPGNAKHFYDQLYDSKAIKAVLVRHETSGAFMAMAYARVSGKIGVCYGCPGPGVANLVPGILEAYSGCMPVLALSVRASTQTEGMGAFQETDHLGMMRPITKWAVTVERAERVDEIGGRSQPVTLIGAGKLFLPVVQRMGALHTWPRLQSLLKEFVGGRSVVPWRLVVRGSRCRSLSELHSVRR